MFFGFNLNEILAFPLKEENRKHLYIGIALSLLGFIIPVIPFIVIFGYGAQIAKQILNDETPHLIAWDDWGKLFQDGLKVFVARFIVNIPILILVIPIMLVSFIFPFVLDGANSIDVEKILPIYFLVIFGGICFLIPISLILAVVTPAAEMKVIETDEFSALFRFKEWWQVFRANLSGFVAAFGIYYLLTFVLSFAIQILMVTVILSCLLIVLLPAITFYVTIIMYVTSAIAYKDGKAKLAQALESPNASA
jgi:hypothetical protein